MYVYIYIYICTYIHISDTYVHTSINALIFLLQAPTHHSFTFNLQFLYEPKHKVQLSKTLCIHFWLCFVCIKVYIFVPQNAWTLKHHNSFQN